MSTINPILPQYNETDLFRDFLVEKPKTFFEICRDALQWFDLCMPDSDGVAWGVDGAKKIVSVFSVPDALRGCLDVKDAVIHTFTIITEGASFYDIAMSIKEIWLAICSTLEAFTRVIKMCDLWNIFKVEKHMPVLEGIGSAADLIVSTDGIVRNIMDLHEAYSAPEDVTKPEVEQTIDTLKLQKSWGLLALNGFVFAIAICGLVSLVAAVVSPIFLALSSAILITDVVVFIIGKELGKHEDFQREVQLTHSSYGLSVA